MNTLVSIRDLHKVYYRGNERIDVLQGVSLDIPEGDFLALMGPSGSGKTTLLNLMGGLDTPTEGSIQVAGDRIDKLSGSRLSSWRARHIGFVFQMYNLLPVLTAAKNVELPLLLTRLGSSDRKRRVQVALNVVGLGDRASHYPRQLSGGQEQRVGIARAIVTDPTLLLVRRADRRSRSQVRRRDPRAADHAQPRARQDHRHGDARSPRGGAGEAHAPPRERARSCRRSPHEVSPADPPQPAAPQGAHHLHDPVDRGGVRAVRRADGDSRRVQHGRGHRRRRSADGDPPRVDHPAAATELRPEDSRHAGRHRSDARQLVRRLLPGSQQLHREHGGRPGELAAHVSGIPAAGGAEEGVAGQSDRRHRRHRHREEVRVEGRRPRAADLADLPQAGWLAVGLHDRRDLRLDEQERRQDAVLLPLRLHERDAARREGRLRRHHRLVRLQGRGSGDRRSAREAGRRDVRELERGDQDRDRKGVHRRVGQAGRRHRLDHDRHHRPW